MLVHTVDLASVHLLQSLDLIMRYKHLTQEQYYVHKVQLQKNVFQYEIQRIYLLVVPTPTDRQLQ
jgi:hypothetical protein